MTSAPVHQGVHQGHGNGFLREVGLPALFGAAVLFFSATMLLGVNISAMRTNLVWIEHAQQILQEISDAESAVVGDELIVRSYALTGDPRFLIFQQRGRRKLAESMTKLTQLAAAEPGGAARMAKIAEAVRRHTDVYTAISGLGPDQAAIVARVIDDDAKRKVMFAARNALAAYRVDELQTIAERQHSLTRQLSQAFLFAVGIIVAAFVLGGVGLMFSQLRIPLRRR